MLDTKMPWKQTDLYQLHDLNPGTWEKAGAGILTGDYV